jgi:hypothetical protein
MLTLINVLRTNFNDSHTVRSSLMLKGYQSQSEFNGRLSPKSV